MTEPKDLVYSLADAADVGTVRDIVHLVIRKMGGAEGFSEEIVKDLQALSEVPGNANKIRLETTLLTLLERVGEADDEEDDVDVLREQAKQLVREMKDDEGI